MCVGYACICVSVWSSRTHFCLFKVKYCSYISPDSTDRGSDLNSAKLRVKLGWNVVILSRPLIPVRDKPFLLRVLCQCFSTQWISNHPMSTNVDFRTKGDNCFCLKSEIPELHDALWLKKKRATFPDTRLFQCLNDCTLIHRRLTKIKIINRRYDMQ